MINKDFKSSLDEAVLITAAHKKKKVSAIESEIAELTQLSLHMVQYWRRGNVPVNNAHIEHLVKYFVNHGRLDRSWCATFLANANYSTAEKLLDSLFPSENLSERPPLPIYKNQPSVYINGSLLVKSTFPHLFDDVWQALKQWHGDATAESPIHYLYLFRATRRQVSGNTRRITNEVLRNALETLRQSHFEDAALLQQRFLDLLPIHRVADQMNVAESTAYQLQKQAIERLTATLQQLEEEASATQKKVLLERLEPSSYVGLVGIEEAAATLQTILVKPEAPWLISLEGSGGIGKTSLADFVLRRLIRQAAFDEVGWVTARQFRLNLGGAISPTAQPALTALALVEKLAMQLLPGVVVPSLAADELLRRLQAYVKAIPHLIVIDNLETLTDVESLLPTLQTLSNPSKFLLTSRQSLRVEPNIYHVTVPELSEEHALRLIRQEAELSNLPLLADCTDKELVSIVKTVGGNPLALRLVAGQTHVHALDTILQDLEQARGQTVENLYTFIYRRAWDSLDKTARKVLLAMPLAQPDGENLDFFTNVCRLEAGEVRLALNKLVLQGLVDARGGLHERRYSIHGLTRTFLQEQVSIWQQGNSEFV